jgi:hypothetical protein
MEKVWQGASPEIELRETFMFSRDAWFYGVLTALVQAGFTKKSGRVRTYVRKRVWISILADHTLRIVKPDGRTFVHRDVPLTDAKNTVIVAVIDGDCGL